MVDPQDPNLACLLVQLVDDSVGSSASSPESLKLAVQLVPHSLRVLDQRPNHEFDHGSGDPFGEPGEHPFR